MLLLGRLEQARSEAAEQESPDDVGDVGLLGQKSQQNHARRHDKQSYAAHGSCVDPFDQQAGDRSHDHNDSGPGSEDQARMYFCISECLLQVEGSATIASIWAMNEQIEVMTETEKIGMRSRSKGGSDRVCGAGCARTVCR